MGGFFNTSATQSSQQNSPTPFAGQQYTNTLNQAANVANTPYNPATNVGVAPLNQAQNTAFGQLQGIQGLQTPYLNQATNYATSAATPITQQQISGYVNPAENQIVGQTMQSLQNQYGINNAQLLGNNAAVGALGGDRSAVASGILGGQEAAQTAGTIGGLESQAYGLGTNTALSQQQAQAQGAYTMGNLGQETVGLGITGAQAGLGAGNQQQAQQQAQLNAGTQNAVQQTMWPYQNTQYLASIEGALGPLLGGTTSGQSQTQNPLSTYAGLGGLGLGLLFSDERMKTGIKPIGKTYDGQTIYKFRFHGDPTPRIGLLAQEVEKKHPEAVHTIGEYKALNYDIATKGAQRPERKRHRATGGAIQAYDGGGSVSISNPDEPWAPATVLPFPTSLPTASAASAFPQASGTAAAAQNPFGSVGTLFNAGNSASTAIFGSGGLMGQLGLARGGEVKHRQSGGQTQEPWGTYSALAMPLANIPSANASHAFPQLPSQAQTAQQANPFSGATSMFNAGNSVSNAIFGSGSGGLAGTIGSGLGSSYFGSGGFSFADGGKVRRRDVGGATAVPAGIAPYIESALPAPQSPAQIPNAAPQMTPPFAGAPIGAYVPNPNAALNMPQMPVGMPGPTPSGPMGTGPAMAPQPAVSASPPAQPVQTRPPAPPAGSNNQSPLPNPEDSGNGISHILETGQSDPLIGIRNISHDTSNSKSYGNYGLNSLPGASAWQFRDQYLKPLGITADPGTPQFDRAWESLATRDPKTLRSLELAWFNSNVAPHLRDLKSANVPDEALSNPSVSKYFTDRMVQMGTGSTYNNRAEIAKAWQNSGGDIPSFLRNVSASDLERYQQYFPHASAQGIYSYQAHINRVTGREQMALGQGTPGQESASGTSVGGGGSPGSSGSWAAGLTPQVNEIMQRIRGGNPNATSSPGILPAIFGNDAVSKYNPLNNQMFVASLSGLAKNPEMMKPFELQQQQQNQALTAFQLAEQARQHSETIRHNMATEHFLKNQYAGGMGYDASGNLTPGSWTTGADGKPMFMPGAVMAGGQGMMSRMMTDPVLRIQQQYAKDNPGAPGLPTPVAQMAAQGIKSNQNFIGYEKDANGVPTKPIWGTPDPNSPLGYRRLYLDPEIQEKLALAKSTGTALGKLDAAQASRKMVGENMVHHLGTADQIRSEPGIDNVLGVIHGSGGWQKYQNLVDSGAVEAPAQYYTLKQTLAFLNHELDNMSHLQGTGAMTDTSMQQIREAFHNMMESPNSKVLGARIENMRALAQGMLTSERVSDLAQNPGIRDIEKRQGEALPKLLESPQQRGRVAAPTESSAPQIEGRSALNGVPYVKIGGNWYKEESVAQPSPPPASVAGAAPGRQAAPPPPSPRQQETEQQLSRF